MPIDFSILERAPTIAQGFMAGQQAAQQQAEQNRLRDMQMLQMEAQRENILAQREQRKQQLRERQAAEVSANELRRALESGDEAALIKLGPDGIEAATKLAALNKARGEVFTQRMSAARQFLDTLDPNDPTAPQRFLQWHEANHRDPIIGPMLAARGITADQARARIDQAVQQGPQAFGQLLLQSKLGTEKFLEMNKPPEPTAGMREYQEAVRQGFKGTFMEYKQALAPKPAQVNVKLPEQERAERGERGKLLVAEYKGISDAARLAARTLPALETQERVLNSGFKTGFGTEVQKAAASVLSALGVPEATKFATDSQTFLAATQQAVLQRQLEQKGPQTEADAQRITQTGAQLGNTSEANRFIIAVAKAQLQRDMAQRNFYDAWWKKNKTYDGAEDAWFSGDGGKSLFDSPALKQYAAPTKPAAAAPAAGGSWRVVR